MYSFPDLQTVCCSMSISNCCFLTYIQISLEAGKIIWYFRLLKNFPQFVVIVPPPEMLGLALSTRVCSNSCPLKQRCYLIVSSSTAPFCFRLQSFLASGSFPRSQFFLSGGQSTGASASASVLPMNIQDWFPLGLTGLISLKSRELSRVFSSTTIQKH